MIKAIFLDFDGTLYSHKTDRIPESAAKAVNAARANGIKVFLCSGRSKPEMKMFDISSITLDGFIYNNGQVIFDDNNNLIFYNPIKGELKEKLAKIFTDKKIPVALNDAEEIYINFHNDFVRRVQAEINSDLPPIKEYHGEDFVMMSAYFDNDVDKEQMLAFKKEAGVTYWHQGAVDIVPLGTEKSSGIDIIIKKYGIKLEETMGVGDGDNDIGMLKHCGIGVAVADSTKEILEIADYITTDIDDDGLYNAFKHFNLI